MTRKSSKGFDYIIVGAGTAGCVMANRLSEDGQAQVLLIEAGRSDRNLFHGWQLSMPAALTYPLNSKRFNWYYETEPQTRLNNRRLYWPRGKVLGGSSSINGMVWIRGHAWDYDNWASKGLPGWTWAECLPYFKKSESRNKKVSEYRGGYGPIGVTIGEYPNPLFEAYIEAGQQAGFPRTEDFNGYQFEGFGRFDMNIAQGRRQNSSFAYLKPATARPNLTIMTGTMVNRILFEGTTATGVESIRDREKREIRASSEVILSGGAVNSPQTLLLSGIGNADELRALGVPVVQNLKGVGRNLQDHVNSSVKMECSQPVTLYKANAFPNNFKIGLQYFARKTGPGATMHTEAGAFFKTRDDMFLPDAQHHFIPILVFDNGRTWPDRHGFQCHVCPLRPESTGSIKLRSTDPFEHPIISADVLATDEDWRMTRDSIKITREVFRRDAMKPFVKAELFPGPHVKTDEDIDNYIRESATTCYHPSSSVKMGTDEMSCLNHEMKVYGVEGLRVVDASAMPQLNSGNTNAPVTMMAEKAADMIRGRVQMTPEWHPLADYEATKPERMA
ncbi:MAG: choline dehydrogenase [Roseovarius sp.]|nr:choline dehydrogenase [Roseovarius sp.]